MNGTETASAAIERLSFTKLSTFEQCPHRYEQKYRQRRPALGGAHGRWVGRYTVSA